MPDAGKIAVASIDAGEKPNREHGERPLKMEEKP
jgi:hypothetical protein